MSAWSWDDIDWGDQPRSEPGRRPFFGGARRPHGGRLSRFAGTSHHGDRDSASPGRSHAAVVERRTLFPTRVFDAGAVPRLLVSGVNSAKIGGRIQKGPWRDFPVFTLTLEERATCPDTCKLWTECYGNAMPLARRVRHGTELIDRLYLELKAKQTEHPHGFAVRAHVLGDFWSVSYLAAWYVWMDELSALHVWGYTAHTPNSLIGLGIDAGNDMWPDRWAFRFSEAPENSNRNMAVTTIWRQPEAPVVPEGIVCPAQTEATAACSTCGLCWAQAAADRRVVFVGHGMRRRGLTKPSE